MSTTLKASAHCAKAARTASQFLWQISGSFPYRDKVSYIKLYKAYVRPHVEFAAPAWSPWMEQDCEVIENVQKKFVRMVSGLSSDSFEC